MKPKTLFQQQICKLSKQLPPISEKQKDWAFKTLYQDYVVISRNRTFCLSCGHKWEERPLLAVKLDGCICPACSNKLKYTDKTHVDKESAYFAVITTKGGYQVIRMFLFDQHFRKKKPSHFNITEVMQHWINQRGEMKSLMKPANTMSGIVDQWCLGDLEPRTETWSHQIRQGIGPWKVCPGRKVLPIIRRNGFNGHFYGFAPQWLFTELLTSNRAETLLKTKQISVLANINSRQRDIGYFWKSINVCTRHGYIIKDATTWFDYLNLLHYFGKDVRNPKYICPDDLQKEHDALLVKKNRIRDERMRLEKEREYANYQESYKREKGHLFGVQFQDGELCIKAMTSIDDFKAEADALSHCVFSNKYFTREDSLIMSARIKDRPVETIEINLKEFKVVQARGKYNKASEHHDRILAVVQQNMEQIAKLVAV
ncbi:MULTISPECIES: PcfJ domain-containing protein [unclassified Carboxylicivirga]|uniref:PcfJ domain-containing protein n=1 Tax=Carboxylicivirga TaxID=1628153 RepID=UPI003D335BDA